MKSRAFSFSAVLAAVLSAAALTTASAATTKTFVVTTTANPGPTVPGTLTWAIYQSNYSGADINYINFNIPGLATETEIVLGETLYIARPMIINAAKQPGYAGKPLIRINCNRLNSGFHLLGAVPGIPALSNGTPSTGSGSTIQGFRIYNYASNAITISRGADSNLILDNYIGFAPGATPGTYFRNTSIAPECRGIGIESSFNTIRGNTISGVHNGITLAGDEVTGAVCRKNVIEHNFIGTDPTGTTKIGNDSDAVFLTAGAQQNLIGPGNVLSGNLSAGVELLHFMATDNRIFGNIIGLNAAGTDEIPNGELGILIAGGASKNWIGGPAGGTYAGNVISACGFGAIAIGTAEFPGPDGSNDNLIEGNLIGTDAAETKAVGSQLSGITVQSKSKRNVIRRNVIVGHGHHGVVFAEASENAMYGNWVGVTSKGTTIGNAGFGVYLVDASNNTVQPPASGAGPDTARNIFGLNVTDTVGVYGDSRDNIIELGDTPAPTPAPTAAPAASRLLNISTRMLVDTGDNALIAGFIITGQSPKKVIVRALGTSLGVAGALVDPTLTLEVNGVSITNDDWRSTQEQEITASGIPPAGNLESAIIATLEPGAYTAVMRGKSDGTGVGLLEVYELEAAAVPTAVVANISTRGVVQSGDNVMIAGFIVGGSNLDNRVVIRALGPSLGQSGVPNALKDPTLRLVDSNGAVLRQSDNWQEDASQASQLTSLSIAPADQLEAALVATVAPGAYTAVVADKNGQSGTGLVEVYSVP